MLGTELKFKSNINIQIDQILINELFEQMLQLKVFLHFTFSFYCIKLLTIK